MKPIQYIKGFVDWYKLKLKVTPDVLIPRPETELLVDAVLNFIKNYTPASPAGGLYPIPCTLIDVGTGSGNIAIALAKNLSLNLKGCIVKIIATDISEKALKVARRNAKLHGVLNKIDFTQSNLLSSVILNDSEGYKRGENGNLVIITNLPYIPSARIPTLDSSVKDFEPYIALDGGENGFELYEKLFIQIIERGLNFDLLIGEVDYTHADLAVSIAKKYFKDMDIGVKKDLAKMPRILSIKKPI